MCTYHEEACKALAQDVHPVVDQTLEARQLLVQRQLHGLTLPDAGLLATLVLQGTDLSLTALHLGKERQEGRTTGRPRLAHNDTQGNKRADGQLRP